MAPDVSMLRAEQLFGWDIAYKRLGPPGTIHIVASSRNHAVKGLALFTSNTYEIGVDDPQELLQKIRTS